MGKSNEFYILKTLEEIDLIINYSSNLTIDDLKKQPAVLDGIVFRMIQMSEHMNNITEDFKLLHSNIDWINIRGFRNRLVHNYGGVDLKFVFDDIKIDIPELKDALESIIKNS